MASPEDTPMKKQWLEVDGRMTPVILPQIWNHDKEEWEVTSEQNPLPTQVTGSNVEEIIPRQLFTEGIQSFDFNAPESARCAYFSVWIRGVTGAFDSNEGLSIWSRISTGPSVVNTIRLEKENIKSTGRYVQIWGISDTLGDAIFDTASDVQTTPLTPQRSLRIRLETTGTFSDGEGFDLQGNILWF